MCAMGIAPVLKLELNMPMTVTWSDSLEKLAKALFSRAVTRTDPFEMECTVVGSPVMAGWLKQYFLYDCPKKFKTNRVLAGWDFKMLHPFVNDWLAKACARTPLGQRDSSRHPYSAEVFQWRIWNELSESNRLAEYGPLHAYVGADAQAKDRKRWGLAARLTQLFDDYQNYRGDLLTNWAKGGHSGLSDDLLWQSVMWRRLVTAEPETYLKQFMEMRGKFENCGIKDTYKRITVFHTTAMPRAYMEFFVELGKIMDVQMFFFNPSREFWIDDQTVKSHFKEMAQNVETLTWLDPPHSILSGFGRGTQALLATVLDVTEGNVDDGKWAADEDGALLGKIQADIRRRGGSTIRDAKDDKSVQFHVCHGPLREVEVAKDLILRWFDEHDASQPRDVQVLVPDMETYAPFIEAVFQVNAHNPPIPCSISKRPAVSAGAVGSAFVRLMKFNESRMTAPEAVELLELDPVRERYGLEPEDLSEVRGLMNAAKIRWGRDGEHLANVVEGADLPDTVTWRRGLDRLLAGFAVGRCAEGRDVVLAGALGSLRVHDGVEGNTADLLGKLGQYFEDLCETADQISRHEQRKVSKWAKLFTDMLERFFLGTESSFIELAEIRRGIAAVGRAAGIAGDPEVGADVMAAALEAQLGGMAPADKSDVNAVLFSPMRTMQVTPRKLIIMLGLNEGVFPRADQRAAFDLLAIKPRYGDRSLRQEDRLAFLEGLMSARERLIITYTGRNASNNKEVPPSPAVTEFRQYLDKFSAGADKDGRRTALVAPTVHKLHGFNPEYYRKDSRLFSYSQSNYAAARKLAAPPPMADCEDDDNTHTQPVPGGVLVADGGKPSDQIFVTLEELQEFFVNPAKIFYTKVLQVQLIDPARDNVSDSEMFDGDTLDDYEINQIMVEDLLGRSKSTEQADFSPEAGYYKRLQEQSLIPLGTFGLGRTKQKLSAIEKFLNEPRGYSAHANLYQALQDLRRQAKAPIDVKVELEKYAVTGSLPVIRHEGRSFLLRFRYATIKGKDRIRAWVAHVVGHAAGETFYTDLIGKDKSEAIPPLSEADARKILSDMLMLYASGNKAPLPFAPICTYDYVEALLLENKTEEDAKEAACEAWDDYKFPEHKDPYLREAWGEDGPMEDSGFGACAQTIWSKFITPLTAGPAVDDAAKQEDGHE